MNDLLEALEQHKKTDQYKKAVTNSKERWARANLARGRMLPEQHDDGNFDYYDLSYEDQELVGKYDTQRGETTLRFL